MLARFLFKLFGWKLIGEIPKDLRKGILAVCPHVTKIDFFVGLGARGAMRRKIGFLGKAELFKPPFGFIYRALGGTPVIRSKNMNLVESYSKAIKEAEDMLFAIAPEGTRMNVAKLKTGFYYMAVGGEIPIIMTGFDLKKKEVILAEPFYTSGDFKKDMQTYFVPFFKKIEGSQKDWIKNYEEGRFD